MDALPPPSTKGGRAEGLAVTAGTICAVFRTTSPGSRQSSCRSLSGKRSRANCRWNGTVWEFCRAFPSFPSRPSPPLATTKPDVCSDYHTPNASARLSRFSDAISNAMIADRKNFRFAVRSRFFTPRLLIWSLQAVLQVDMAKMRYALFTGASVYVYSVSACVYSVCICVCVLGRLFLSLPVRSALHVQVCERVWMRAGALCVNALCVSRRVSVDRVCTVARISWPQFRCSCPQCTQVCSGRAVFVI